MGSIYIGDEVVKPREVVFCALVLAF
ncbi:hypothetical protein GGR10_001295, partial [Bartonella chomelii]|nr:hypothetical protein [Bartonella chomelii]MBA9083432.1 hypothetical protein [Bartonella chomelii]